MLIRVFLPSSYCILSTVSNEANIDARQHYVSPLLTLHSYQTYQPQQTYFHFWHGHSFSSSYLPHCLGDFLHAPSSIRDIASIFHDRDHTQPLYHCAPTTPQWHNSELRNLPENNATMTSVEDDPCGLSHLWKDYLCVWFWNLKSTGQVDSCRQNSTGGARTPQRWTKTYVFFVVSDISDWVCAWYRAEAGALSHGNKHTQLTQ